MQSRLPKSLQAELVEASRVVLSHGNLRSADNERIAERRRTAQTCCDVSTR